MDCSIRTDVDSEIFSPGTHETPSDEFVKAFLAFSFSNADVIHLCNLLQPKLVGYLRSEEFTEDINLEMKSNPFPSQHVKWGRSQQELKQYYSTYEFYMWQVVDVVVKKRIALFLVQTADQVVPAERRRWPGVKAGGTFWQNMVDRASKKSEWLGAPFFVTLLATPAAGVYSLTTGFLSGLSTGGILTGIASGVVSSVSTVGMVFAASFVIPVVGLVVIPAALSTLSVPSEAQIQKEIYEYVVKEMRQREFEYLGKHLVEPLRNNSTEITFLSLFEILCNGSRWNITKIEAATHTLENGTEVVVHKFVVNDLLKKTDTTCQYRFSEFRKFYDQLIQNHPMKEKLLSNFPPKTIMKVNAVRDTEFLQQRSNALLNFMRTIQLDDVLKNCLEVLEFLKLASPTDSTTTTTTATTTATTSTITQATETEALEKSQ